MLRIPAVGERPAPLVVPVEAVRQETVPVAVSTGGEVVAAEPRRHRRRRRSRRGEAASWDSEPERRRSGGGEKRQMFWMLIGGATLLVLLLGGVLVAMLGGDDGAPAALMKTAGDGTSGEGAGSGAETDAVDLMSDAEFTRLAEPLARRFLEAAVIGDLLPLVREPDRAKDRMRGFYPDGTVDGPGLSAFNTRSQVVHQGPFLTAHVRTRDFEERPMYFHGGPGGLKVDWESWVGWSQVGWGEFLSRQPTESVVFRVVLSDIHYYNRAFQDERKWRSYRLESADKSQMMFGYTERDSVTDSRLRPGPDVKQVRLTVGLRFPAGEHSLNQVVIDRLVSEGWALENEDTP